MWVICSWNIHFADTVKNCQPAYAIGTFTVKIKQTNSTVQVKNQVSTLQQVLPHTRPKYIGQWCLDDALRKPVPVCDRSWNEAVLIGIY
jgi:hypothetical protein